MNKAIAIALSASLAIFAAETSFIAGALLGARSKSNEVENACIYTNRIELTKGKVMGCWYLDGVRKK